MFFLSCERVGDKIYERYIDDNGQEQERYVDYEPTFFHHAAPGTVTKFKDIYGKACIAKKFPSMNEANKWRKRMNEMGQEALGMDDFVISYLSDTYTGEIRYNRNKIRVAWVDIEVTAPEFPKPEEAKYPIDAITHYDSIHDRFFVFDLVGRNGEKWEARKSILRPDIVERVVYNVYDTEDELLLEYIRFFEENRPVGFTGWNTETFDIPYIIKRISNKFGSRTANRIMLSQFFGEEEKQLNEHEIAWLSRDWDKVAELADTFTEKTDNVLFKLMDNITLDKQHINVEYIPEYNQRWINTALSQHADCIYSAYVMNLIGHGLPDQMHHDYLVQSISKGKRYGKWAKLTEELDQKLVLMAISKAYIVNMDDARFYLDLANEKGYMDKLLKHIKPYATDELLVGVTKNQTERKRLKKIIERW